MTRPIPFPADTPASVVLDWMDDEAVAGRPWSEADVVRLYESVECPGCDGGRRRMGHPIGMPSCSRCHGSGEQRWPIDVLAGWYGRNADRERPRHLPCPQCGRDVGGAYCESCDFLSFSSWWQPMVHDLLTGHDLDAVIEEVKPVECEYCLNGTQRAWSESRECAHCHGTGTVPGRWNWGVVAAYAEQFSPPQFDVTPIPESTQAAISEALVSGDVPSAPVPRMTPDRAPEWLLSPGFRWMQATGRMPLFVNDSWTWWPWPPSGNAGRAHLPSELLEDVVNVWGHKTFPEAARAAALAFAESGALEASE